MSKKKKILLLSDDCRMHSGVATVSKDIITETIGEYDWAQIGAAIEHPEMGKIFDISEDTAKITGVKDAYLKIYPMTGYGNPQVLREIIELENPDALMIYTDPRFWMWFFNMENELRQKYPIFYYNIWDDLPDPHWNT